MRLISFLGTGDYRETTYSFGGSTCRTRYVAHALATFTRPSEIRLIATTEAWEEHGATLAQVLSDSGHPYPSQVPVPTGGEAQQLWQMFGAIVDVIRASDLPILLDITHGFRMQPFFAAACIQYVQSVLPDPPPIRVTYGEYRNSDQESPIWELTPFLDVLSWSRNLMMFLRTGQADEVVEPTKELGRELRKQWAATGRIDPQPELENLGKALEAFGNDFITIRTGSLLIGTGKDKPSAQRLWDAIERTSDEVAKHLPALALVLDQVQSMVAPLSIAGARLSSPQGQRSLLALARLYQKLGRYSEAISILREGWITLDAPSNCDMPGTPDFDNNARRELDAKWARRDGNHPDPVAELRNDIQHAGFKKQPHERNWFEEQLTALLTKWQEDIESLEKSGK
jgi:CRISPR-associated protein Csx16